MHSENALCDPHMERRRSKSAAPIPFHERHKIIEPSTMYPVSENQYMAMGRPVQIQGAQSSYTGRDCRDTGVRAPAGPEKDDGVD